MKLFYEISAPQHPKQKHYLFGTIHSNDPRVTTLPQEVKFALNSSSVIAVEADTQRNRKADEDYVYRSWNSKFLAQHQRELQSNQEIQARYQKIKELAPEIPLTQLHYTPPTILAWYLIYKDFNDPSAGNVLDDQILTYAKINQKQFYELETNFEHTELLFGVHLSYETQQKYLKHTVDNFNTRKVYPQTRLNDYIKGVINENEQADFDFDAIVYETTKRDIFMAYKMCQFMENPDTSCFVAVGAAHLKGISRQLMNAGYIVKVIQPSERRDPPLDVRERDPHGFKKLSLGMLIGGSILAFGATMMPFSWLTTLMLVIGTLICAIMLYNLCRLAIAYHVEPRLPLAPPTYSTTPFVPESSITPELSQKFIAFIDTLSQTPSQSKNRFYIYINVRDPNPEISLDELTSVLDFLKTQTIGSRLRAPGTYASNFWGGSTRHFYHSDHYEIDCDRETLIKVLSQQNQQAPSSTHTSILSTVTKPHS